jgi:osmotically-inducible protein OsmY
MKPDADLQARVLSALVLDPRVDESSIGVSVHRGVVTLNGAVSSYGEKAVIGEVVHRVCSVLDVANDLEVKPSWQGRPSDTEIAEAARNALAAALGERHDRIQTTVEGRGHVVLDGRATRVDRELAERSVRAIDGVELVTNTIEVV